MKYSSKLTKHMGMVAASMLMPATIYAQTDTLQNSIERDVDVINTYLPTILNPMKMQVEPAIDDTMQYQPQFKYTVVNKTQAVSTTPDSLAAAGMKFKQDESPYKTLIKAGGGNYTSMLGEIYYNIGMSEKYHLSLGLGHHSMLGKVELPSGDKVKAPNSTTWAKADFASYFKKSALGVVLDFRNQGYEYYGQHTMGEALTYKLEDGTKVKGAELLADKKQRITNFDADINIGNQRSIDQRESFSYSLSGGFGLMSNKTGLKQTDIRAAFDMRTPIKSSFLFDTRVGVRNFSVSVPENEGVLYTFSERKHTDIDVTPHVGIDIDHVDLRVGLRLLFEFDDEADDLFLQPDIHANFNIADDIVSIYFGMSGGYRANSFRDLVAQNPYVSSDASNYVWKASKGIFEPSEVMPTTKEDIKFTGGIKAQFSRAVEMHLGIDYHTFTDELFFVNKGYKRDSNDSIGYSNLFGIIAENGKTFTAMGELNIRPTDKSNILLTAKYHDWTLDYLEEPWYKPGFEVGAQTRFYPTERLLITAGVDVMGERYAYDQTAKDKAKLPTLVDVNLGGEYYINSHWTAYLTVNNCAAQDYERWLGYTSHGLNAMAGVLFKF